MFTQDEIYVIWDDKTEDLLCTLSEYFTFHQPNIMLYIFITETTYSSIQDAVQWPTNFKFNVVETQMENMLVSSLISFVLEHFYNVSQKSLSPREKSDILFIQKDPLQYCELKKTLYMMSGIKPLFYIKLVTIYGSNGLIFRIYKKKELKKLMKLAKNVEDHEITDIDTGNKSFADKVTSKTIQRHRIKELSKNQYEKQTKSYCTQCFRARGSFPCFKNIKMELFCLTCYIDLKLSVNLNDSELKETCETSHQVVKQTLADDKSSDENSIESSFTILPPINNKISSIKNDTNERRHSSNDIKVNRNAETVLPRKSHSAFLPDIMQTARKYQDRTIKAKKKYY